MNWKIELPQIIWIVLTIIGLMASSYMHGKPKIGNNSVWVSVVSIVISLGLLFWGGFFTR